MANYINGLAENSVTLVIKKIYCNGRMTSIGYDILWG